MKMLKLFFYASFVNYAVFGHYSTSTKIKIPASATGSFKKSLQALLEEGWLLVFFELADFS